MSKFARQVRQTLVIARRDFIASVFTPVFLIFLLAPLIFGSFSVVGGLGAANVADGAGDRARVVAILPISEARPIAEIDTRLRRVFRGEEAPPALQTNAPEADVPAQARALFASKTIDAAAVMYGPLDRPTILYGPTGGRTADYLAELAEQTLRARTAGSAPLSHATKTAVRRQTTSLGGRHQSAFVATFGIFFLTLFLAGQVVGTMAEERNNKVIEVLAAAVPLESVFLGKLLGTFGMAVLFVGFWGAVASQIGLLLPPEMAAGLRDLTPAIGFGRFALLFVAYFTMAFLLLGSVFLAVGAQASTMREIQMLSLPITIIQVAMFALASAAASHPGTPLATFAEVFPLSSPFAMVAHAANSAAVWPHLAALSWQLLWVTIFITIGARLFRRGVLQSTSAKPAWKTLFKRGRSA